MEEKNTKIVKIKERMLDDSLPLKKGATNLVLGEGNPDSEIFFLGEAPGYWEDQKGRPFVGNAGALLNNLLQSIKLPREEVFISNVISYRPPDNRDPLPEELAAFQPYIDELIEVVNPKIIVTLGRFSMGKFIPNAKISLIHGKLYQVSWKGKKLFVVPMFHPAAALRSSDVMTKIKNDFLNLPKILQKVKEEKTKEQDKSDQMKLI